MIYLVILIISMSMVKQMDNFVSHKYGIFKESQIEYYQEKLRKKIFWLVLYTDKNTKADFDEIDVVKYHEDLLFEISRYNELLLYPEDFVEIINALESALYILKSDRFNFRKYKKLVFDAGALLKHMKVGDKNVTV